jgi:TPR repeat protein
MACETRAPSGVAILAAVALAAAGCSQVSRLDAKCVAGDVLACRQLGDMYANGRGVTRDLARAGQSYERACNGGEPDVCNTLGEIVEMTGMVDGGTKRAEQLFLKACQGGSSPGCLNLGLVAAAREEFALAVSLYEKSCDGGWAPGCHQLGLSYQDGEGVAKDTSKAVTLFTLGCDGEFVDSCLVLGNLYFAGEVVPKDTVVAVTFLGKALKLYNDSCTAGIETDCAERDRVRARLVIVSSGQETILQGQPPTPGSPSPTPAGPIK